MFDISREKHYLHSFFSFQFSLGIWVSILSEYPHLIVLPAWPLPCNSSCFPTMTWPYFVSSLGARLFTSPLSIQSIHEIHLAVILPEQTAKRLWNKSLRYVCPTISSNLLGGWTTPSEKYDRVKLETFPQVFVKIKKYVKLNHHLVIPQKTWTGFFLKIFPWAFLHPPWSNRGRHPGLIEGVGVGSGCLGFDFPLGLAGVDHYPPSN